jgi:polysaccharide pyruvyl transferase WcaK-like protein
MPLAAFMEAFATVRRLVTNSYHVAYWGLLSGRPVTLIGYSSKFTSLMRLLHLDPTALIPYTRGDGDALARAVAEALSAPSRLFLKNYASRRQEFCELNIRYSEALVRAGLFEAIRRSQSGSCR